MRQFTEIKLKGTGATFKWNQERQSEGRKFYDEHQRSMTDTPHPDFKDSLEALKQYFMEYFGFKKAAEDNIDITGIKLSTTAIGEVKQVSISGKLKSAGGQTVGMSAARILLDAEAKPYGFEEDLNQDVEKVIEEATQYLGGKSAQLKLPLEEKQAA